MRGKVHISTGQVGGVGITPAYAGKSSHQHGAGRWRRDHPRVCGEKAVAHIWWYSWIGSPPRMRGKDGVNDSAQAVTGITPACAGKSSQYGLRGWFFQDHPRVCGEKITLHIRAKVALGSPPRMRGKDSDGGQRASASRITPAYAEKRYWQRTIQREYRDHPRICGEKLKSMVGGLVSLGSPPRMRGKGQAGCKVVVEFGITPACAGKRLLPSSGDTRGWDHPPRMRGKGKVSCLFGLTSGITPAYAGKREKRVEKIPQIWDHPRVCGEKGSCAENPARTARSPPRMRGKETPD